MKTKIGPLFPAIALSTVGNWMTSLVIFGWVFHMTNSPTLVGIAIMCHRLPILLGSYLFSPQAATTPARVHAYFDFIRAFTLSLMAMLIIFASPTSPYKLSFIAIFLLLAAIRSLLSGADYSAQSTIISKISEGDKNKSAHSQLLLSIIFGLSGFVASLLFVLGVLSISLTGVIIFDTISFLISGCYFLWLAKQRLESIPKFSIKYSIQENILKTTLKYHETTILLIGHGLRTIGTAVGLQQWLLMLQVKYGMGHESMGYLYMTVTAAWFLSAQWVRFSKIQFKLKKFLILSILVCLLIPLGWYMPSLSSVVALTFLVGFIDGTLLATISSDLQRLTRENHTAHVFGSLTIITQSSVVLGSLLIGATASRLGYSQSAIVISGAAASVIIILYLAFIFVEPFIEWSSKSKI